MRAVAAGLLIAVAAPPLGLLPILAWFAIGQGEFSLPKAPLISNLPVAYFFGGIQTVLAGILVAWGIYRQGWVSLAAWMALTTILGLVPVIYLMLMGEGSTGLFYMSHFKAACYLMVAAFFASLVLRVLVIALGWMRRPQRASAADCG
jgi:hypothetical protein